MITTNELPKIAAKRGTQTLVVALVAVVVVYAIAPLVAAVTTAESWRDFAANWEVWTWEIFRAGLVAGLTAIGAWLQRRFFDKGGISDEPDAAA